MKRVAAVVILVAALAGCGARIEANAYNLPDPTRNVRLHWVRIDSPSNYPTIVHACWKGEGYYVDQDAANSVEVQPGDPTCNGNQVVAAP